VLRYDGPWPLGGGGDLDEQRYKDFYGVVLYRVVGHRETTERVEVELRYEDGTSIGPLRLTQEELARLRGGAWEIRRPELTMRSNAGLQ
jgi:hypothetical protein